MIPLLLQSGHDHGNGTSIQVDDHMNRFCVGDGSVHLGAKIRLRRIRPAYVGEHNGKSFPPPSISA